MKTFKQYMKEDVSVEKNTHILHLEDMAITEGPDGLKKILASFKDVIEQLAGVSGQKVQIKTKYDGAPSLICGINPENGEFFVGTKSVFNKLDPKINYTDADIDKNHEQSELRKKLKFALKYLPELEMDTVLQGDMLFVQGDVKKKEISGKSYVTFRPNTITYAIPEDSELADEIKAAKVGIVFHTEYKGSTMASLKASLKIDLSSLKKTKNVWWRDADFENLSKKLDVTKKDLGLLKKDYLELKNIAKQQDNTFLDKLENDADVQNVIMMYGNYLVRNDAYFKKNSKEKYDGLISYIRDKFAGEVSLRKSEKGKERRTKKMDYVLKVFEDNKEAALKFFEFQNSVIKLKQEVINKLNQMKTLGTYIDKEGEMLPTEPEGFVAVSDDSGAIKWIDRDTYSRLNFNIPKQWKSNEK